jgi:hypothetical protein
MTSQQSVIPPFHDGRSQLIVDCVSNPEVSQHATKQTTPHIKKVHSKLIAQIIGVLNSEGARALSTTVPTLHNRKIEFIVASHYSKTFIHFSKGFAIFFAGDQENTNNGNDTEDYEVVVQQKLTLPSLLLLASAISTQAASDSSAFLQIICSSSLLASMALPVTLASLASLALPATLDLTA